MDTLKETFNQYKWVLLAGIIVAILIALITANMHVLQFMNYKMQNNADGVLSILKSQVKNEEVQDDWFFTEGMQYLLGQEQYSEELSSFYEDYFEAFSLEWKKEIITAYNKKKLTLTMNKEVMDVLIEYIDDENIRSYITRLSLKDFEQGLLSLYGNNPVIDETLIETLYKLLNIYPEKLSFEKFQFNLHEVLNYTGENAEEKIKFIFSKIEPEIAKENIFKELRNKAIGETELCEWIEFFKSTGIISNVEYTKFNEIYGKICLIRNQYNELDVKEVELKNKKAEVETKISVKNKTLEEKQTELAPLESEISTLQSSLDQLTNCVYMPLYLEKLAGTGSNEYIASHPRNNIFGKPKPSSLKYIVKLKSTEFSLAGIYNLNLYSQGTTKGANGDEYGYYVEVSNEDIAKVENLENEKNNKINALNALKQEINQLESDINTIKKEHQYDETVQALKALVLQREEYIKQVDEEVIEIRKLFGLSNIEINIKSNAQEESETLTPPEVEAVSQEVDV